MSDSPKVPPELVQQIAAALIAGGQVQPKAQPRYLGDRLDERRRLRDQERLIEGLSRAVKGEEPFRRFSQSRHAQAAEAQATIARLTTELEETKQKLSQAEETLKRELLNPSARSGLERVLVAVIAGGYGVNLDEDDPVRTITSQIVEDAENINRPVDPKTARKYAKEAVDNYKRSQRSS